MAKDKYYSIQVYIDRELHRKLKEKLAGISVSAWFQYKVREILKNDTPIQI